VIVTGQNPEEATMAKFYRVTLTDAERCDLKALINRGKGEARKLTHARILLQADEAEGGSHHTDPAIAETLSVSARTVERVRQRFVEQGLDAALVPKPSERVYARLLDGAQEARLIALACSEPPEGKPRWTLRLLADRMVELDYAETLSYETVRRVLKKTNSSRIFGKCGSFRRKPRPTLSLAWRMSWRFISAPIRLSGRWSVWTRPSPS
jgi:transposase